MQEYTKTDQQLHLLSQLITKVNRTFVPKKEDDSHTNLFFDTLGNRITGRWVETGKAKLLTTLNLDTQTIEVINEKRKTIVSITTISKHIAEIEKEIEKALPGLGLKPAGFTEALHFEIPQYNFAQHPIININPDGLSQWKQFRHLANQACYVLMGYVQKWDEVRIWPHHFDTGIYIEPNDTIGIGFGLAMLDEMVGEPYFYFSAHGLNGHTKDYSSTIPLTDGKWFTENWKGAALPLNKVNQQSIHLFIDETLNWGLENNN